MKIRGGLILFQIWKRVVGVQCSSSRLVKKQISPFQKVLDILCRYQDLLDIHTLHYKEGADLKKNIRAF